MQKSKLVRTGRKGFTLVEVALAVAVGLIVIGGAIVGFNAVRENAQNSGARSKVDAAVAIVENLAASNNQIYPTSSTATASTVSTTWAKQRPDFGANPWGGPTADTTDGVTEWDAMTFGAANEAAVATATALAAPATAPTGAGAGNLVYVSATSAGLWGKATDASDSQVKTVKGYLVTLYDKNGAPFWYVKGGH